MITTVAKDLRLFHSFRNVQTNGMTTMLDSLAIAAGEGIAE